MIIANINPEETYARVAGLWQYDYGQVLRIQGLSLPPAIEIHFSLQETGGRSNHQDRSNQGWSDGCGDSGFHT